MNTVLIIDDDPSLGHTLAVSLRARDFEVVRSETGEAGIAAARRDQFDVIVVDLGLPRMTGMEVIRKLRTWSTVPILVLSARNQEPTKVQALEAGADDYVTKPFGFDELVARLHAAMRRGVRADGRTLISAEAFTVDFEVRSVIRNNVEVHLTPTEWRVLELLVGNEDHVVEHSELLTRVWGPDSDAPVDYARVYVASLRRKLEIDAANPRHLLTESGKGYRFRR